MDLEEDLRYLSGGEYEYMHRPTTVSLRIEVVLPRYNLSLHSQILQQNLILHLITLNFEDFRNLAEM